MADETASFRDFETEFIGIIQPLPGKISDLSKGSIPPEEAAATVRSIDKDIVRAKERLSDMDAEVRGMNPATRTALGAKIRTYRTTVSDIERDVNGLRDRTTRSALLAGGSRRDPADLSFGEGSMAQRERMAAANERMKGTSSALEQGRRILAETEEVAMNVTSELDRNRSTLENARRKVGEVTTTTDYARRILRSMGQREVRYKIFLAIFIIVVLVLIGVVVYFAFIK